MVARSEQCESILTYLLVEKLLVDGDELANHLSRNNTLHDYKETDEESLVWELKRVKVMYDTLPEDK